MAYTFDRFRGGFGVSADYLALHDFLVEAECEVFTYARLDWMITHRPYLEESKLPRIGLWRRNGKIVAADLFDTTLDDVYPLCLRGYEDLYPALLDYALDAMRADNPDFHLMIDDRNEPLRQLARGAKLAPTDFCDRAARIDLTPEASLSAPLPDGFRISDMSETRDYRNYLLCLHRGFGHEEAGEPFAWNPEAEKNARDALMRPHADASLKLNVVAPNGDFACHCGLWYDPRARLALIEPLATAPAYRRMGLARAAVYEGLRRVRSRGAAFAVVGSSQPFYYAIGMRPSRTFRGWA